MNVNGKQLIDTITRFINTKLQITEAEITFIHNVIDGNPDLFHDVSTEINAILERKQFTISDIPQLVHIFAVVFKDIQTYSSTLTIYDFIEICVLCLLYENVFHLPAETNTEIENMVKYSITLLKTNLPCKSIWLYIFSFFHFC